MRTQYEVENSAGGTAYAGSSLKMAMEFAVAGGWAGYVISKRGTRPVIRGEDGRLVIGNYGESVWSLNDRTED